MSRRAKIAVALIALCAVLLGTVYAMRGDRYALYTNAHARSCWSTLKALALSNSRLSPAGVDIDDAESGDIDVRIRYRLDRVLAGAELESRCRFEPGSRAPSSVTVGGNEVDDETLRRISEAL